MNHEAQSYHAAGDGRCGCNTEPNAANVTGNMSPEPLTETELDSQTKLIERFGNMESMNLEETDGFLAALVCCADDVSKAEYVSQICGDQRINGDSFAAQPALWDFLWLIDRHRESVPHTRLSLSGFCVEVCTRAASRDR